MLKRHAGRAARPDFKTLLLATASVVAAGACSTDALAQDAAGNEVDELVVTGYR